MSRPSPPAVRGIASPPAPVLVVDDALRIVWISPAVAAVYDVRPGRAIGTVIDEHFPDLAAIVAPLLAGVAADAQPPLRAPAGPRWPEWTLEVLPLGDGAPGTPVAAVILRHDRTAAEAERDHLLVEVARLVNHGVLNDLTIIQLYAETMREAVGVGDLVREQLGRIAASAVHSAEMLQMLSRLTRDTGTIRTVDMARMVAESHALLRAVAAPAELVVDLPDGPLRCWVDVDQTRRGLVELVARARHGLGADGRIYVSVAFGADEAVVAVSSTAGARFVLPLGAVGRRTEGRRSVLVVLADPALSRVVDDALSAEGCTVHAATPMEAIDHVAVDAGEVGLLIADLDLPEISGVALAGLVRRRAPEVAVLVLASHLDAGLLDEEVLLKPFGIGELIEKVDLLLG